MRAQKKGDPTGISLNLYTFTSFLFDIVFTLLFLGES